MRIEMKMRESVGLIQENVSGAKLAISRFGQAIRPSVCMNVKQVQRELSKYDLVRIEIDDSKLSGRKALCQ